MYILDNHNILLILENVISIRKMLEQQNDFLIRMKNKNDRGTALAATDGINRKSRNLLFLYAHLKNTMN